MLCSGAETCCTANTYCLLSVNVEYTHNANVACSPGLLSTIYLLDRAAHDRPGVSCLSLVRFGGWLFVFFFFLKRPKRVCGPGAVGGTQLEKLWGPHGPP